MSFACFSYIASEDCYVYSLNNSDCSYFPKEYLDIPLSYCVTYGVLPWWRVFHNQHNVHSRKMPPYVIYGKDPCYFWIITSACCSSIYELI